MQAAAAHQLVNLTPAPYRNTKTRIDLLCGQNQSQLLRNAPLHQGAMLIKGSDDYGVFIFQFLKGDSCQTEVFSR